MEDGIDYALLQKNMRDCQQSVQDGVTHHVGEVDGERELPANLWGGHEQSH